MGRFCFAICFLGFFYGLVGLEFTPLYGQSNKYKNASMYFLFDVSGSLKEHYIKHATLKDNYGNDIFIRNNADSILKTICEKYGVDNCNNKEMQIMSFGQNVRIDRIHIHKNVLVDDLEPEADVTDILGALDSLKKAINPKENNVVFIISDGRLRDDDIPERSKNVREVYRNNLKSIGEELCKKYNVNFIQLTKGAQPNFWLNITGGEHYLPVRSDLPYNYYELSAFLDSAIARSSRYTILPVVPKPNKEEHQIKNILPSAPDFKYYTLNDMESFMNKPTEHIIASMFKKYLYDRLRRLAISNELAETDSDSSFSKAVASVERITKKVDQVFIPNKQATMLIRKLNLGLPAQKILSETRQGQYIYDTAFNYKNIRSGNLTFAETEDKINGTTEQIKDKIDFDWFKPNIGLAYVTSNNQQSTFVSPQYSVNVQFKRLVKNPRVVFTALQQLGIDENTNSYLKKYYDNLDSILFKASIFSIGINEIGEENKWAKMTRIISKNSGTWIDNNLLNKSECNIKIRDTLSLESKQRLVSITKQIDGLSINSLKISNANRKLKKVVDKKKKVKLVDFEKNLYAIDTFLSSLNTNRLNRIKSVYKEGLSSNKDSLMVSEIRLELMALLVTSYYLETLDKELNALDKMDKLIDEIKASISDKDSKSNKFIKYVDLLLLRCGSIDDMSKRYRLLKEQLYINYAKSIKQNLINLLVNHLEYKQLETFVEKRMQKASWFNYFSLHLNRNINPLQPGEFGLGLGVQPNLVGHIFHRKAYYQDFPITVNIGAYFYNGQVDNSTLMVSLSMNTYLSDLLTGDLKKLSLFKTPRSRNND